MLDMMPGDAGCDAGPFFSKISAKFELFLDGRCVFFNAGCDAGCDVFCYKLLRNMPDVS